MPIPTNRQIISALYVATFDRAPDDEGLTYWESQFTTNSSAAIQQLAAGFASHPAFTTLYDGLDNLNFVEAIYTNVLGGPGDAGGIAFWTQALTSGALTRSQFLAAFVESALSADFPNPALSPEENAAAQIRQDYLYNKADVGLFFADTLGADSNLTIPPTDPDDLASLEADPAYQASQAILAGVTNDDASVIAALGLISTASTQPDPVGYINDNALSPPGNTFALTHNTDTINASSTNSADLVSGVIDGTDTTGSTGGSTYTNNDTVNGNGHTTVELVVAATGTAAIANLNNVADVNLVAGVAGPININGVNWSGVDAVNLTDGANGLDVILTNLENDTDLSIFSGVAGTISADYQSHLSVDLHAGEVSAISWIDGNVDATVAAGEGVTFTAHQAVGDVTVGDINATVGKSGNFDAFVSSSASGDINVGDVTITAETNASVSVSVSNEDGGSVTVGDVSMLGGDFEKFGVFNINATGDVLVGDVAMSVSASGSLSLTVSNTGTTGQSLGSLTVGAVDLVLDHDSTGEVDIFHSNSYTTDGLSLGALTVGDMAIELGRDAQLFVSISHSAIGATANVLDSFGDVDLGNLDANIGTNSFFSYDVFVNNSLAGDIASVTIGDVNLALADGAAANYFATVTAEKGNIDSFVMGDVVVDMGILAFIDEFDTFLTASNGGNIGTVEIGDLTSTVGQDAVFDNYTLGISATSGTIDSVTVGNVSAVVAAGGSFSYFASVSAQAVGDVTFGDFDLTSNGAASLNAQLFVSASLGDVGSVTVGDVSIVADGTSTVDFSVSVTASGDAGVLTVGNISIDTTISSTADVTLNASGVIDGDITIGGFSLAGSETGAYDGGQLFVGGLGFSGDVNLGDISVGVSLTGIAGASTAPSMDLTSVLAGVLTTGDITIGSVDYSGLVLDWTAAATDTGNGVTIDLTGYLGNTSVIGSDYNDEIDDNTGTNQLTGGDGADLFVFDTTQTNKTLATMDRVLDFSNSGGDKLNVGVVPTVGTYAEGSFTDFAAFNSAANAADEEVFVGAVTGSDLIVAADFDGNGAVDFMIQLVGLNNLNQIDIASFV
ncbi:MAG: DUF4214 domain-containing protein [Methylococcales bacterium]|nr:DUF4214 domain-containing protein [Methylococcales bacterium]